MPAEPVWLEQVHGNRAVDLDGQASRDSLGPADAAATARSAGRVCAIQVADCLPVLFAAADGSVVGAAHAGWRGLAAGCWNPPYARWAPAGAALAWIGPAIGPAHFEVGEEVRAAFLARGRRRG